MVEDKKQWEEVSERITHKINRADLKIMYTLHAKYFNHKYNEPCTCNKVMLRKWIGDLTNYFKNK